MLRKSATIFLALFGVYRTFIAIILETAFLAGYPLTMSECATNLWCLNARWCRLSCSVRQSIGIDLKDYLPIDPLVQTLPFHVRVSVGYLVVVGIPFFGLFYLMMLRGNLSAPWFQRVGLLFSAPFAYQMTGYILESAFGSRPSPNLLLLALYNIGDLLGAAILLLYFLLPWKDRRKHNQKSE